MKFIFILGIVILIILGAVLILRRRNTQDIDYNDVEKILDLAEVYDAFGEKDKAVELLNKAIQHNPGNAELQNKLHEINRDS